jgi:hypothetical protein
MTKWLVLWEMNPNAPSPPPEELPKHWLKLTEMTKGDLQSGVIKDFGLTVDGSMGYAISELGEKELYASLLKYSPWLQFKVHPMLSIDESAEIIQKVAEQPR